MKFIEKGVSPKEQLVRQPTDKTNNYGLVTDPTSLKEYRFLTKRYAASLGLDLPNFVPRSDIGYPPQILNMFKKRDTDLDAQIKEARKWYHSPTSDDALHEERKRRYFDLLAQREDQRGEGSDLSDSPSIEERMSRLENFIPTPDSTRSKSKSSPKNTSKLPEGEVRKITQDMEQIAYIYGLTDPEASDVAHWLHGYGASVSPDEWTRFCNKHIAILENIVHDRIEKRAGYQNDSYQTGPRKVAPWRARQLRREGREREGIDYIVSDD